MLKIIERISNSLPVVGGGLGAVTKVGEVAQTTSHFPSHEIIIQVVIVSVIGAICGYLVKLFLDLIVRKCKNKRLKK